MFSNVQRCFQMFRDVLGCSLDVLRMFSWHIKETLVGLAALLDAVGLMGLMDLVGLVSLEGLWFSLVWWVYWLGGSQRHLKAEVWQ